LLFEPVEALTQKSEKLQPIFLFFYDSDTIESIGRISGMVWDGYVRGIAWEERAFGLLPETYCGKGMYWDA